MLTTPHSFRNHLLAALVGLIALTGMTQNAPAQCQSQKLLPSDGAAGDNFGVSVAISGDTAVIGARFDDDLGHFSGSAYVFEKVGGVWTQVAKLNAADGAEHDGFGRSVAVSGNTAVIGATGGDGQEFDSGAAYVFEKVGGVWAQIAKLNADDGAAADGFGSSVAVSGDTAVVGAWFGNGQGFDSGAAYVFEKLGGVWTQVSKLTAADGAPLDVFGISAAVNGNTAVIGAVFDNDACPTSLFCNSGSAYVFEKVSGVWTQTAKLTAADGARQDEFGISVAISGDTAVIGARFDDDLGRFSGSAYVFEKVGGVWTQVAKLNAADGAEHDGFGRSVAVNGDTALIGATGDDDLGFSSGSAYVFEKVGGVWTQTTKLNAADGAGDDEFGISVAISGDTSVIGAQLDDDFGSNSGSAYVFVTSGDDCNDNSVIDACDIASGTSADCNANGIPDDCEADSDGDGVIDDCNDRCLQTPFDVPVNVCGCAEVGACCATGGGCDDLGRTVCVMIMGVYQGDGSSCAEGCAFGDVDGDGDVDLADVSVFQRCFTGAGGEVGTECMPFDIDGCGSIELDDFTALMDALTGPTGGGGPPPADPVCGNGVRESGEECDDGNVAPGDGCNELCQLEAGFCGDGILALTFEECDDGNNVPGDGCDENCLIERPPNDECADAITVFDGDTNFDNISATTDGPDEPATCDFGVGTSQVDADVWFCYEATCNGIAVASLCGSDYDTKLAVYDGCTCPPTQAPLGCSDDDCGAGTFDSRLTFAAVQGQSYSIRIGGFTIGSQGTGTLAIRCDEQPVCSSAAGDCFAADGNGSPGCDDATCCDTTCAVDPFCCDVTWDATCAAEAQGLCTGSFDSCSTSTGTCEADNGGAGCEDESCCNSVCAIDPFCCTDSWDDFCATEAASICGLNCGTAGTPLNNACDEVAIPGTNLPVAGCSDEKTCRAVCAVAPECCLEEWGQRCVCLANPSDPCCLAVCAEDAFCCSTEWDDLCDQQAADLCSP